MLNLKKLVMNYELLPVSQTFFPFTASLVHAVGYTAVVLFIACLSFQKRDF
jgi:hypothetical protein